MSANATVLASAGKMPSDQSSRVENALTRSEINELFQIFLGRDVGSDSYVQSVISSGRTILDLVRELRNSEEFALKRTAELGVSYNKQMIDGPDYRTPRSLGVRQDKVRNVLLIGSCLIDPWPEILNRTRGIFKFDRITFNNASALPKITADQIRKYDYEICQSPLRSIIRDTEYLNIKYYDTGAYESLLAGAKSFILMNFERICAYNAEFGITTFVLNFVTPQQNPMGRLQERYYLGNIIYFIEQLNKYLSELAASRRSCYIVDFDQIVSNFGKKYYADDLISHFNHAAYIYNSAMGDDRLRIEPMGSATAIYTPNQARIVQAVVSEVEANFRTIQQTDSVKLVIFDLDDTLWRGVGAERDDIDVGQMTEGWPLSIVEAASYLWRRGILIAIVSKNDEKTALSLWEKLYGSRFNIKNFVATRINWNPKAVNIAEILKHVNLLPESVLFIDDNPVERAAVKAAFPGIRVMDAPLVHWRRILLWAPELQQPVITNESAKRTEMIQAQVEREDARQSLSREEFLNSLSVVLQPIEIAGANHPRFDRCFELLNKTNQFNTTGRRWSAGEIEQFFSGGGRFLAFEIQDKFTAYGLTALVLIAGNTIEQFVMSCRVFGLEVEKACVVLACKGIVASGSDKINGKLEVSGRNALSMSVYQDQGFEQIGGNLWVSSRKDFSVPPISLLFRSNSGQ
jgi:FkbH-like protein